MEPNKAIQLPSCDTEYQVKCKLVRKRDGRMVPFDAERILRVICAALLDTKEAPLEVACEVYDSVLRTLSVEESETLEFVPDVEHVQDIVEASFMTSGLPATAKSYILYRYERAMKRAEISEQNLEKVEKEALMVVKRSGDRVKFDFDEIHAFLTQITEGIDNIDIPQLLQGIKMSMYDGMTTAEISQALVMVSKSFIETGMQYSSLSARILMNELYREVVGVPEFDKAFDEKYRSTFINCITRGVDDGRYDVRIGDGRFDMKKLTNALDAARDRQFEYMGFQVLYDRYFMRTTSDEYIEVPQYFWMRIAMGLAVLEKNPTEYAIKFYETISTLHYVPSTPTLLHAGTHRPQMSSCYLNYVADDLTHIFKVIGDNAQMSKWSGGIGTSWSAIRATNAKVSSINVPSQGLIPFLKIVDSTTASINRSGKRRGAVVVYLENWHLDFEEFLDLRKNTGDDRRRTHDTNTATWISDLFMKRLSRNGQWTLFSPDETPELHDLYGKAFEEKYEQYEKLADEGKIRLFKRIQAQDLWRKMITMLFETGHPWITFKDPCNIRSPQDHVGVVHSSNLCTEITLNTSTDETAVCNLGSINLPQFLKNNAFEYERMKEVITVAMRMLDNVVELNYYPTQEGRNSNMRHRPVGLGIMGLQDCLFALRMPFDSKEAVQLSDELMERVSHSAILASTELAKERGAYESFKGSKWERGLLPVDTIALLESERGIPTNTDLRSVCDWEVVRKAIKKSGMRNSNCMAIAPTATIANISGSLPSIEPIYKNIYTKSNFSGEFTVVNSFLVDELATLGLWSDDMLRSLKHYDGSIQAIPEIPEHIKAIYKEAFEISPEWVIEHAVARGKWIDQSQSVNLFVRTQSGKLLSDIYQLAWQKGMKTTYYLRTLGATSVEKSTIDINKKFDTAEPKTEPITPALTSKNMVTVFENSICESCQ